jgi:hypothetical protein
MLAKSPGDRQQTPVDLVSELAEIIEELGSPLPYAAGALGWTLPSRSTARWRRHAAWAAPIAGLILLGVLVDRFSRDDATAAPFPELRTVPTATASPLLEEADDDNEPAAPSAASSDVFTESQPALAPSFEDPLPLREDWGTGLSLWDSVTNWPATAPPRAENAARRAADAFEPEVDVGLWPTPAALPSPTVDLDIYDEPPADESPAAPATDPASANPP